MLNSEDIKAQKRNLRKAIKISKNSLSLEEKKTRSQSIWQQIENLSEFKEARTIMLYWSMDDEVYTHDFIEKWHTKKTLLLPAVDGDDLRIKVFDGINSMRPGPDFGILEPTGHDYSEPENIDMIIVPGVAFDHNNNRMGRGRGFYDRLLCQSNAIKVGVCFLFQYIPVVPTEPEDIKMDMVVTEQPDIGQQP